MWEKGWCRDKSILALGVYLALRPEVPKANGELIGYLSEILNERPGSLEMRLRNFRYLDSSAGPSHVASLDRQVWEELQETRG